MTTPATPINPPLATRAIRIDQETYAAIWRLREPSETFAAALRRLLLKELSDPPGAT